MFKIVTLAAALEAGVTEPGETFPVQTAATLEGVQLRNAGDESCGGTLTQSFAHSCNSVFGPLGARLGARRLVRFAEAFGFNEELPIPDAKVSSIPPARDLADDLAVGASAIGQDRDLATPLTMAASARRSRTAACAPGRGWCAARRWRASGWSSAGSRARCAT